MLSSNAPPTTEHDNLPGPETTCSLHRSVFPIWYKQVPQLVYSSPPVCDVFNERQYSATVFDIRRTTAKDGPMCRPALTWAVLSIGVVAVRSGKRLPSSFPSNIWPCPRDAAELRYRSVPALSPALAADRCYKSCPTRGYPRVLFRTRLPITGLLRRNSIACAPLPVPFRH